MNLEWWSTFSFIQGVDLTVFIIVFSFLWFFLKRLSLQVFANILLVDILFWFFANAFNFPLMSRLTGFLSFIILISCLVLYSSEIRRSLDRFRFGERVVAAQVDALPLLVKKLLTSVDLLCKEQLGALIVIEGQESLDEYVKTGIQINGSVTSDLLISLFWKGSPTHDGAVVLRFDNIVAAGCFLPLTDSTRLDQRLGTRHQAAIGLSERSDSFIIVVSEETSTISIVESGTITRYINRESLETKLFDLFNKVYQLDTKS